MLVLSFLLLMVVFRSLLVPLKAVIMNLLSIGAAYGVIVAVFQWGWGASLIGVGREGADRGVGADDASSPSCSASRWTTRCSCSRASGRSTTAPATTRPRSPTASRSTARVITAAALDHGLRVRQLRARSPTVALKLIGLGLAIAVLIDATIVRMVLVPGDDGAARRPELVAARSGSTGSCRACTSRAGIARGGARGAPPAGRRRQG